MKSSTHLDYVIFQLTPTRTRYDLVISAKGNTEKIASGLLIPFLSHLKTAKDQIDKGGYSILLEPDRNIDTKWFTKGTVERFVRFVNTPEILERVYLLESEILQLEKAISIQENNDVGFVVEKEHKVKSIRNKKGVKSLSDANHGNAVVLYTPETHTLETNGSPTEHRNPKFQLLKILETRKNVMEKEQGMAFARAVAANFDIDHISPLLSFAECFGASRLMEACLRFVHLWKQKHETGQWVEVEAAEATSTPPDLSAEPHINLALEKNGKSVSDSSINDGHFTNPQAQAGQQQHYQGQFPYPLFPIGMQYHQPYPGCAPFYKNNSRVRRRRRHSVDNSDSDSASELVSKTGAFQTQGSRKKNGKPIKKQTEFVVIRNNVTYVASEGEKSSDSEFEEDVNKNSPFLKRKGSENKSMGETNLNIEEPDFGKEFGGHWEAFQNLLLRDSDEKMHHDDQSMFGLEKNIKSKIRKNIGAGDLLTNAERDPVEAKHERNISGLETNSENANKLLRSSNDETLISRREGYQMDNQLMEIDERKLAYRYNGNDDFITVERECQSALHSADPLTTKTSHSCKNVINISQDITDESFIVPLRSMPVDQVRNNERIAIDMDSEFPSAIQKSENKKTVNQFNFEPDFLGSMPERGIEKELIGYDPALDYEIQAHIGDSAEVDNQNKEAVNTKQLKKSKITPDSLDKKSTLGPIRKGKPSKSSSLEEARARAEKLRSYKADLQKLKKEKEEEQQKRLEDLKKERQKRIAAKSGSTPASSPSPQQAKRQFPAKNSLNPHRNSKFSDAKPGSSSPLQRSKLKNIPLKTPESLKAPKTTKSANDIQLPNNRLIKSVRPDPKASRRLFEPNTRIISNIACVKTQFTPSVSKPKVSIEPESKKIAAIINLDKQKAAALPGLKIKRFKRTLETGQKESALEETSWKGNINNNEDDNTIIDKGVLMFESEKPYTVVMGGLMEKYENHKKVEKVNTAYTDKEPPRIPSTQISEIPYQPPFARLSSIEDPCTRKSQYGETPLLTSNTAITDTENNIALISGFSNLKIEKKLEFPKKNQVKDSPKGFKRFLRFGKICHSSSAGEQSLESDKTNAASSSEVNSLKDLMSQDDSPADGTTTYKHSRHFSFLSPFRSKISGKKST